MNLITGSCYIYQAFGRVAIYKHIRDLLQKVLRFQIMSVNLYMKGNRGSTRLTSLEKTGDNYCTSNVILSISFIS